MKLAILSRAPRSYSTQRLRTAALDRGHQVKVLNTLRFGIDLAGDEPDLQFRGKHLSAYDAILPHARVFVTNGGWTGVLLALAHGVPVLQVGKTEEKADIGRRVEWAGAGLHLGKGHPQPQRLARGLERLERPKYARGARRIAQSLASRDPGRDGAELILDVASRVG